MKDAADLCDGLSTKPSEQMSEQEKLLRRAAMDLLARREHSRRELLSKLQGRCTLFNQGTGIEVLEGVLDRLEQDNLLSDSRFAESFVRYRAGRGYGPVRIRQELMQRGIDSDLCRLYLESADLDWYDLAWACYERRFGSDICTCNKEKMKQIRYLQCRGFDMDMINTAIRGRATDR